MAKKKEGGEGGQVAILDADDKLASGLNDKNSPAPDDKASPSETEETPEQKLLAIEGKLKESEIRRSGTDRTLTAEKAKTSELNKSLEQANKLIEELERKELNAFEGDTDATSVIRTMQENRRLKIDNERLEGQLSTQDEQGKQTQFDRDVDEVAKAQSIDAEELRNKIDILKVSDKEGIQEIATLLAGKTAPVKPPAEGSVTADSAKSTGTPSFNADQASSTDKISEGLRLKKK